MPGKGSEPGYLLSYIFPVAILPDEEPFWWIFFPPSETPPPGGEDTPILSGGS